MSIVSRAEPDANAFRLVSHWALAHGFGPCCDRRPIVDATTKILLNSSMRSLEKYFCVWICIAIKKFKKDYGFLIVDLGEQVVKVTFL